MPQDVPQRAEEILGEMESALQEAGAQTERIVSVFGEGDMAQFIEAMRVVAGLQTTLGDLALRVEGLRRLLVQPNTHDRNL